MVDARRGQTLGDGRAGAGRRTPDRDEELVGALSRRWSDNTFVTWLSRIKRYRSAPSE